MTLEEYLAAFDESDANTTAAVHVGVIAGFVVGCKHMIELGTHQGLSTAAFALAEPSCRIVTADWGDDPGRRERWAAAGIPAESIMEVRVDVATLLRDLLRARGVCDLIFHDATHGDAVIEEYMDCAAAGRTVAIHDFELLSLRNRERVLGVLEPLHESADSRGRVLFVGRQK